MQRRVYRLGRCQLALEFGDITASKAQVVVSSDDYYLTMSGGVSAAIRSAGGTAIALDAAKHVPLRLGDVVVTTAGTLPARYVFHAVTIGPGGADTPPEDVIHQTTKQCLSLLGPLGVSSIALPAIGAGTADFPLADVAGHMARAIAEEVAARSDPIEVTIYLFPLDRTGREMTPFDYGDFFDEFARKTPSLSQGKSQPVASTPTPVREAAGLDDPKERYVAAGQELLELEQRRQLLEDRIITLRNTRAPQAQIAATEAELTSNLELRSDRMAVQARIREQGVRVFVSYAHEDAPWCAKLRRHLASLRREGLIRYWYDREIRPGSRFDEDIKQELDAAQVILLLLSDYFMDSDYIANVEIPRAVARYEAGQASVIPVVISSVDWQHGPLGQLNALPRYGRPVDSWQDTNQAMYEVAQELRSIVEQRGKDPGSTNPPAAGA